MNILDAIGNINPRALTKDSILNLAYGSNMLGARILQRIPGARLVGRGILRGYQLKWHKVGQDGSGKCDVVSVNDRCSVVHGVVYALSSHEKELLDRFILDTSWRLARATMTTRRGHGRTLRCAGMTEAAGLREDSSCHMRALFY